jgi:hypothetical protein
MLKFVQLRPNVRELSRNNFPICTTDFLVRRLVLTDMDDHRTNVILDGY